MHVWPTEYALNGFDASAYELNVLKFSLKTDIEKYKNKIYVNNLNF